MQNQKPKVLYIVGEGRSGSTLLERVLGQHKDIFSAGELKHIWERSFLENQLCSCNAPFKKCLIWKKISENFLENLEKDFNPKNVIEAFNKTCRIRHFFIKNNFDNMHAEYINYIYTNLYKSIQRMTNKKIIVDASKHPVFAHLLLENKNIDIYFLHLVRDPRGVAYSWKKKKIRPEITGKKEYMPRYSVVRSAASWLVVNNIAEKLKYKINSKYIFLRYEDFITNPKTSLSKIYNLLNISNDFSYFINDKKLFLHKNHTVAGNPIRFKIGEISLKLDEEWKKKMPRYDRYLTTLLTYPYLKRYSYI